MKNLILVLLALSLLACKRHSEPVKAESESAFASKVASAEAPMVKIAEQSRKTMEEAKQVEQELKQAAENQRKAIEAQEKALEDSK